MRIEGYNPPKSSFLSTEKDTALIVDKIMRNVRLQRLLYYTSADALTKPNISTDQIQELFQSSIKLIPKIPIDSQVKNYMIISFENFYPSENPEFKDNIIEFDIICHYDCWKLKEDFALRPYKIAGEIDSMLNGQKLTGIGLIEFVEAHQIILDNEFAGLCVRYRTYHGGEDTTKMPNQKDEQRFQQDYKDYING